MCSVTRWSNNGVAEVIARNMGWLEDMKSNFWVFPRGMDRSGLAGKNSLKWTSKYASVITSVYDEGSSDGINEKNLSGHLLWLAESDYGKRNETIPGLSLGLWLQYFSITFLQLMKQLILRKNNRFRYSLVRLEL